MKKLLYVVILFISLVGCNVNSNYTSKDVMAKIHNANLTGMYMGDVVEEFGKPYEVNDSIIYGEFNYRDLSYPFKDSMSITFTYMRPNGEINDVAIIVFAQDQHTLNTPMEALWNVYYVAK